ncbi:hypothetical protein WG66_004559 [Moniliophthora roreri]|nr:hypothetical protein WG66_004559 [Moniliophthora roreri]
MKCSDLLDCPRRLQPEIWSLHWSSSSLELPPDSRYYYISVFPYQQRNQIFLPLMAPLWVLGLQQHAVSAVYGTGLNRFNSSRPPSCIKLKFFVNGTDTIAIQL